VVVFVDWIYVCVRVLHLWLPDFVFLTSYVLMQSNYDNLEVVKKGYPTQKNPPLLLISSRHTDFIPESMHRGVFGWYNCATLDKSMMTLQGLGNGDSSIKNPMVQKRLSSFLQKKVLFTTCVNGTETVIYSPLPEDWIGTHVKWVDGKLRSTLSLLWDDGKGTTC